jgi:polar amino acid transport system substrate-binding protein
VFDAVDSEANFASELFYWMMLKMKLSKQFLSMLLFGASILAANNAFSATDESATRLRVCADPDSLPFSKNHTGQRGIYLEYADMIGQALQRPVDHVWVVTIYGERAIRASLLSDRCDIMLGLPQDEDMGPKLILSKPFMTVGYALATTKGSKLVDLAAMQSKKIGVEFGSPAQSLLAVTDGIEAVTYRKAPDVLNGLVAGEIEAGFVWGPSAGYFNKEKLSSNYTITPVEQRWQFGTSIGLQKKDAALRDQLNGLIDTLAPKFALLMEKYGFPTGAPIMLAQANSAQMQQAQAALPEEKVDVKTPAAPEKSVEAKPAADHAKGNQMFNNYCSHCHGPDAVTGEKRQNLRNLSKKYGERMNEIFATTLATGRLSKGMPKWAGVISDEEIAAIKAYIDTVQEK